MVFKSLIIILAISPILCQTILDDLPIRIQQVPWQVSVQINGRHICGGALYSSDIVLTAAQCIKGHRIEQISVRAGSLLRNFGGQVITVRKVRMQVLGLRSSDVAIILLSSSFKTGYNIRAIPLASYSPKAGTRATVSGWGQLGAIVPPSEILLKVNLNIVDQMKCSTENVAKQRIVLADEICAAPRGIIPLACQGFSGGPLVSAGKLVGIVSWNNQCGFLNIPSTYANIPLLKLWIETTSNLMRIL
ncbi:hypothetical protein KR074_002679 [Drosophila pseudoananassae]|nr:hypothetical protein KR074_002679 [Drosophila pseudoananassae]